MLRRLDIVLTTVTGQLHTPVVNMLPITADCEEWKINHRSRHTDREDTMGHFTLWISLSLRPNCSALVCPEFELTNHAHRTSPLTP